MRIVLVVPGGVDPPGSARTIPFVHHLVERLSADHRVVVLATGHDAQPGEWRLFDADVINIPVGTHSKADIARVVATATRRATTGGRPDVVHALWANLPGLVAGVIGRRHGVPVVVSVGGGEFANLPDIGYGGGLTTGTRLLAGTAVRLATTVTVATQWMRDHVRAAGVQVGEVIPLGADTRIFQTRSAGAADPAALVHIGSLNRVKDQDLLLRAMAILTTLEPGVHLTIAGADTLHGHHARLAAELGVTDRVTFTGHLPPQQLAAVVRDASWHVLTSRHDAGPVAVLEAAASGVPTVGVRVGHVADFTAPDFTGPDRAGPGSSDQAARPAAMAIEQRTPDVVAHTLLRAIGDGSRPAIAERAERWARTHDADATAAAFEMLYRRLAASSSRRAAASSGSAPRRSR